MKKKITEEMGLHKEWYEQAKEQTLETLQDFINHLLNDYEHEPRTIAHAITAGALATMRVMRKNSKYSLYTFQNPYIPMMILKHWAYIGDITGFKIINFDEMVWPEAKHKFDKTITREIFEKLQNHAKFMLDSIEYFKDKKDVITIRKVDDELISHLKSIVDGNVPFGYKIEDNE